MKEFIKPYYFESSCYKTPQFKHFACKFRNWMKKNFKSDDITFNIGHFYISGFIKRNYKFVYFSISDVRPRWDGRIMYRTAENEKDYHGGTNHRTDINNISDINSLLD